MLPYARVLFELGLEGQVGIHHKGRERGSGKGKKNIPDEGKSVNRGKYAECLLPLTSLGKPEMSQEATRP